MNILYYGFGGNEPNIWLGITWALIALAILIGTIIFIIIEEDTDITDILPLFLLSIFLGVLSIFSFLDNRYPIVKATMNETIPWKEVESKYELESQEGDIYIFKVKNTSIEEWVKVIDRSAE